MIKSKSGSRLLSAYGFMAFSIIFSICNDSAGQAPVVCLTEWIAPGNAPAFQEKPALV